jgi:hypothetical protein
MEEGILNCIYIVQIGQTYTFMIMHKLYDNVWAKDQSMCDSRCHQSRPRYLLQLRRLDSDI